MKFGKVRTLSAWGSKLLRDAQQFTREVDEQRREFEFVTRLADDLRQISPPDTRPKVISADTFSFPGYDGAASGRAA